MDCHKLSGKEVEIYEKPPEKAVLDLLKHISKQGMALK